MNFLTCRESRCRSRCPRAERSRGLIIPTALFLVLILFALVTAIQLTVTQNFQVTRHGHARTQARYMAKAQAQRLLERLNRDATAEQLYTGEARRSREESEMGRLEAWVEPGPEADVLLVIGRAWHRTGVSEQHTLTVLKRPPTDPVFFARPSVATGDASTLVWTPGNLTAAPPTTITPTSWQPLPPIPNSARDDSGNMVDISRDGEGLNPFAHSVHAPTADFMGNVYAVRRRGAGFDDRIVRFNLDRKEWTVLPPVPNVRYKKNGERDESDFRLKIAELATDGAYRLFACHTKGPLDTLFVLDQSAKQPKWEVLPPAEEKHWTLKGEEKPATGNFADRLRDLTADSRGNLYARQARGYVDSIYRYDTGSNLAGTSAAWTAVRPPPRQYWKRVQTPDGPRMELADKEPYLAQNLSSLSVGGQDELYGIFNRSGVDTIYRYDPPTKTWSILPYAPKVWVGNAERGEVEGDPDLGAPRLRRTGVDSHGTFYVRWNRDGIDSVFMFDPANRKYGLLAPVPKVRWNKEGRLIDDSREHGNRGVFHNLPDIFAGGRPKPGAGPRYVQVSSF